jgi:hypothetical protein
MTPRIGRVSAGQKLTETGADGLRSSRRSLSPPRSPVSGPATRSTRRTFSSLYGGGQFVASIVMFAAGGYGALRKTRPPDRWTPSPPPACSARDQ